MKRIAAERNVTLPPQQEHIPSLKNGILPEPKSKRNHLSYIMPFVLVFALYNFLDSFGYTEKMFGGDKPHKYTEQNLKMEMETLWRESLPIKLDEITTIVEAWAGPGLQRNFLYEIDSTNFMRTLLDSGNEIPDSAEKFLKFNRLSAIEKFKTNSMSLNHAKQGTTLRYVYKFKGDDLKIGETIISPKDVLMDADLSTDDILSTPKAFKVYPGGEEAWEFRQGLMK